MNTDRNISAHIIADNAFKLGWKPSWDKARFLENIDDEVAAVLELGKAKSSLVDSLILAAKGWIEDSNSVKHRIETTLIKFIAL